MTRWLLERARVDAQVRDRVLVEVTDGRFTRVEPDSDDTTAPRVPGLTLPGLANTHSHAFHRALRGRSQARPADGAGSFWTWREQMYALADRLDPDSYYDLARATYAEMVASGYTSVGEFHYLHHRAGGVPYADPNAMGRALIQAALDAGLRIALLDTLYLRGGFGMPVAGVQQRFADTDAHGWADRVADLTGLTGLTGPTGPGVDHPSVVVGAAAHSVRAVPTAAMWALAEKVAAGIPTHVHLSEQPRENQDCLAAHGLTPTRLLTDHGLLGPSTTVVHATHLTGADIDLLAAAGVWASLCPTTERDLADGIGPGRALADAGVRLTLGSDSHAVIDPFEEMRALETDERLATGVRGRWDAAELIDAGTRHGHASLGFADVGSIAVGQRADLVTLDTGSPRTAGTGADDHTAVFAATAADVTQVVVDGRVVFDGDRARVGRDLAEVIERLWA